MVRIRLGRTYSVAPDDSLPPDWPLTAYLPLEDQAGGDLVVHLTDLCHLLAAQRLCTQVTYGSVTEESLCDWYIVLSSLLEEVEDTYTCNVVTLQKDANEMVAFKEELEKELKEEKENSAGMEKEIEKLELEMQRLEFAKETVGAKMEINKTLNENVFYCELERERMRWKQSSDEIIFDLM